MDKPFLSINDQIKLLNARGVKTDDNTYNLLLSEGYYSLVNGYKDPFIDMEKRRTQESIHTKAAPISTTYTNCFYLTENYVALHSII